MAGSYTSRYRGQHVEDSTGCGEGIEEGEAVVDQGEVNILRQLDFWSSPFDGLVTPDFLPFYLPQLLIIIMYILHPLKAMESAVRGFFSFF